MQYMLKELKTKHLIVYFNKKKEDIKFFDHNKKKNYCD